VKPTSSAAPPAIVECAVGALVAHRALREAVLGDLAEEFAARCAQHGAARARRWYLAQAARSTPHLLAACLWPAPTTRRRRLGALLAGVLGGYLTLLLLHQTAQFVAGLMLADAGHASGDPTGWAFAACSLAAGAGCGVLGGNVAARALPDAPLAAAFTLALVCGALAVTGMLVNGGAMPLWYWGGLQLLVLPVAACLGGLLLARRQGAQRWRRRLAAVAFGLVAGAAPTRAQLPAAHTYAVVNGHWFDGRQFVSRSWWMVDGLLRATRPARVDSVIDLAGTYVVPPFGEAHNHNVEASSRVDALLARYLRDGVFYVKNPNNLPRARSALAGRVNTPTSIDVAFANGGLTASGGHPVEIVARNIARGTWTAADGEGAFYWTVNDDVALDRKWPAILAGRPDFIKTYLLYSEEYARRRDDTAYVGWKGLNPALLPEIVRRAHRAGLRVSTHVETAADFRAALAARVDEINHVPGFRGDEREQIPADARAYEVTDADARRAVRQGTVVVTTLGGIGELDPAGPDSARRRQFDALAARNLRTLVRHGVHLALGSDSYDDTSVGEALYLHDLGVLSNAALLRLWSEATPQAIFPGRRLGRFAPGAEASFLALAGDPLADFAKVRHIVLRVKQGRVLGVAPE
jgi:imidazolonepropionase-like amidohydrolase